LVPLAEDATLNQLVRGAVACVQVAPALVEDQIGPAELNPPATATNLYPSEEEDTPNQGRLGMLFELQVSPASVEVQIWPLFATAASLLPSADAATNSHPFVAGALVSFQVAPEFVEV
jgi:hypothetical protein